MSNTPFDALTRVMALAGRTRRDAVRTLTVAGVGTTALAAVAAEAKKRKKKRKKKPVTLQTDLIACPGPGDDFAVGPLQFAQTFVAARTGALTAAQLEVGTGDGTDLTIQIRAVGGGGVPTEEVLASANADDLPDSSTPPRNWTLAVLFDPPPRVVKDEQYAVLVRGPSAFRIGVRGSNVCPGEMFGGSAFNPLPGRDVVFAVSITSAT